MAAYPNFEWQAYETLTEDGWYLTLFRIRKTETLQNKQNKKSPVLCIHGASDTATTWAAVGIGGPNLPLGLVEKGYDVWMANSRGTKYSNRNVRDGKWDSMDERWAFSWADMGLYDLPANLEKISEETGIEKVTIVGYSQGSAQTLYALAKNEDFYVNKVNRFLAVAACFAAKDVGTLFGIYNEAVYAENFASGKVLIDGDTMQLVKPSEDCEKVDETGDECSYKQYGQSLLSWLYFHQNQVYQRF